MEGEGERSREEYKNTRVVALISAKWPYRGSAFVVINEFRFDDGLKITGKSGAWGNLCESAQ